jgi:hypothetical protein
MSDYDMTIRDFGEDKIEIKALSDEALDFMADMAGVRAISLPRERRLDVHDDLTKRGFIVDTVIG